MKDKVFRGLGKRKLAIAQVRLLPGKGKIVINKMDEEKYFTEENLRAIYVQPLKLVSLTNSFDIYVNLSGGGRAGQAGALRHGISRALVEYNPDLRAALKKEGFLTRDARVKERKKAGQPGARKRFQFSKR